MSAGLATSLWLALLTWSPAARAGTYVQFRTVWGDIEVELYDHDKPLTVQNFLRYVQSGRYQDSFFHRCPTNRLGWTDFVVQGGGWFVANLGTTNPTVQPVPRFAPVPNEFGVGRRLSNVYGSLAMAKVAGDTNSATSEWFFNLNDNTFLDAEDTNNLFVVFGRIIRGTNALNWYIGRWLDAGIQDLGGPFSTLPVTYGGDREPTLADLEYVDISLLNVQIRPGTNSVREISWNSVTNTMNRVQFTTNLPPIWHLLVATNGHGGPMKVFDTSPNPGRRFYRVKVDFE